MNWWRGKRPQDQAPEPEAHRDPENETAMSKQDPPSAAAASRWKPCRAKTGTTVGRRANCRRRAP